MPKIWFSYSFPPGMTLDSPEPNRSPYHLTWHHGRMLRDKAHEIGWDFEYVNLDDDSPRTIGKEDLVLGHAWFNENAFMQQVAVQECRGKFILQPYTEKMVGDEALDLLHLQWGAADHLFLNTGAYWFDRMPQSDYAQYYEKSTRLDNVVNPDLHPFKKTTWNPPGKRGFLAIGYSNPIKGLDLVADLARVAGLRLLHLGSVPDDFFEHVPQISHIPGLDFNEENIEWLCEHYDFFITMGRFDANPTTLSEVGLWGMVSACTEQCGYYAGEPFIELKLDGDGQDLSHNWDIVDWLQYAPVPELKQYQEQQRNYILEHHNIEKRLDIIWNKMAEWL